MQRLRIWLGLSIGVFLVLSSGAHSFLGWKGLRAQLVDAHAADDLITGLGLGWHFAGGAMLVFGLIIIASFAAMLKQRAVSMFAPRLIGLLYVVAGTWSYIIGGHNPFFLGVFFIPGTLLMVASTGNDEK